MDPEAQKIEQAIRALRAMGIESAQVCMTGVSVSAEDAMKMILVTDADRERLFAGEQKIRKGVRAEIRLVQERLIRLEKLAGHSPDLCKKGEHILDSYATGGRDSHVRTNCLACTYSQDGYD